MTLNVASGLLERMASPTPAKLPLTRRQSLFWLDDKLFPSAPYHQIVLTLELRGALDVPRFQCAYRDTLLALDQFRLVFVEERGRPSQRLASDLDTNLELIDLREAQTTLDAYIARRCMQRLDLTEKCFDAALLRTGEREAVFYFCQHHIISDGTSVSLFLADLARRYEGLPVAPRTPYAQYVLDEESYANSPRSQRDARYFAERLSGGSAAMRLYGRAHESRSVGVDRSFVEGGRERWQQLTELTRDARIEFLDESMSRLVALATVLFAYLARVTGERSLVLGTPVPNRNLKFADTCGLIMEQVFLAVTLAEDETFTTLAAKVRTELLGALRHGRHCASDRGVSYATLNLLRIDVPQWSELEARVELFPATTRGTAPAEALGDTRDTFGLHILGFERDEQLRIGFDFHRATFEPALRERAKRHFLAMLDAFLADLDRSIDEVCLVDDRERAELLLLGRGAEHASPPEDPLLRLLDTADARREQPAVIFGAQRVRYGELTTQVGRLAALFRERGVRPGSRVGMCLERGVDELRVMLAAWAAGAAYVPTDPTHPPERIRMILEDAAPDLLVSSADVLRKLELPAGLALLDLDRERATLEKLTPLFETAPSPEQLAYVLFTSGSTGRPKGVAISRGALANFLRSMAHTPGMQSSDRLLAVTTTTFDIAGLELHLPLWTGASVHIADRETVRDPALMRKLLEREPITIMQATPTTWRLLLEAGYRGGLRPLRMLCGGEALSDELAQRLSAVGELWNMYGPTETTVWSTLKRIATNASVTVGRPIDHTQVYVLDAGGELVPAGVAGELCIGGLGVAQGYLGLPELTARRFVQSRFSAARDIVYRTGDLARVLPTGELACLGRLDHQVKVRGFRIELGEVESALRKLEGVRDIVVAAYSEGSAESYLVAYFVGDVELAALREQARAQLPSYMHPSAYVALAALPLNTNGKVDRSKLPRPDGQARSIETGRPPADDDETTMASLFEQVLHVRGVPADRDFFELGGSSVSVLELRQRIQETFGVELPLGVLFETPTVQRLVAALAPTLDPSAPAFVPLRSGRPELAPLLCLLGVALYKPLAQALHTDRSVYGLHIPQRVGGKRRLPTVESIAEGYVELILRKVPSGPYHLAGLCFGGLIAFEVARQLQARGHEIGTLAIFDAALPRGSRSSPRARLTRLVRELRAHPQEIAEQLAEGSRKRLRALSPKQLRKLSLRQLLQRLREGRTQAESELDVMSPIAQTMVRAYDARRPRLAGSISLFRAGERLERAWRAQRKDLGWSDLVDQVWLEEVAGSHLTILEPPRVHVIADVLARSLSSEPTRDA